MGEPVQEGAEEALMKNPSNSAQEVADAASADTFQISLSTLYRYVSPKGEIRQLPQTA
jgi:hypothetical protein